MFYLSKSYFLNAFTLGWDGHPGSNSFVRNASISSSLSLLPMVNAPKYAIFASLLNLARLAEYISDMSAEYAPLTLLAAIDTPMPVPQINMPLSKSPQATASATSMATLAYIGSVLPKSLNFPRCFFQ